MTPPGNGGRRVPHLTLVSNGDSPVALEPGAPEAPPPSAPEDRASLPPRSADVGGLRALIAGDAPALNHYQRLTNFLAELGNPTASGGFDLRIPTRNNIYHIVQEAPGAEIRVRITQERRSASGSAPEVVEIHRLTYLPDGTLTSTLGTTPHAEPTRGAESTYHGILRTQLSERAQALFKGEDLFLRLRHALGAFRGRYIAETQSAWYDHFVVHEGRVFSFRRTNVVGLSELISSPQLNQIEIFEERGTEKVRIATLSANGEAEFEAGRSAREPLNHNNLNLLETLVPRLEEAMVDPKAYETRLRGALAALPAFAGVTPTLERSVDLPRTVSVDTPQGYVTEYRNGWDLLRHLFGSHRWQNPQNLDEVHQLRPHWRIRRAMSWELLRWAGRTTSYAVLENIRNPKVADDRLRLELHAGGGSQLTVYRDAQIYDILIAGANGSLWRANQEIRQLNRDGITFPNRTEALRAAVARYNPESALPVTLQVQEAPTLDLNRFHLDAGGAETRVTSAQQAWELLRRQLPPGVEPRVEFRTERGLLGNLFAATGEPNRILVHFRESQPALSLDISHQGIRVGDAEVPRVQILMRRGEDHHARVFEDGVARPDLARDVHQASLRLARQGHVARSVPTRLLQGGLRAFTYVRTSGLTYGLSHFMALPFQWAHERLVFNDFERRTIGTPGPAAQLTMNNLTHNVLIPFGAMAASSGAGTVLVDGFYNAMPGVRRSIATWHTSEATLAQAWRFHRPGFYNPSPFSRPAAPNFFFRGFLQRAVPLFLGVTALDRLHSGQWFSPMFWRNTRDVAAVSATSAGLMRLVYASPRLSGALVRRSFLTEAAAGAGGARYGLTFRGGLALAVLEMIALGVVNAHERRALLAETGRGLRVGLGAAIDRRNELITRLENGEEVEPRHLIAADAEVHNAQGAYRRFLELTEHTTGTGNFTEIGGGNDFDDEMRRYERARALLAASPGDPLAAARLESEHRERLSALSGRYERMEADLNALYARYDADGAANSGEGGSLRAFLRAASAPGDEANASETTAAPATSPVAVDSEEGRAILEQLRWKAADDPGSVLWSRERRADYILAQFRGYRVAETDGSRRPWNRAEALAFLDSVDRANVERIRNFEAPLTMPGAADRFDTRRLEELIAAERTIRERESSSHRHAATHAAGLADNTQDLDRQMADYYRSTNERTSLALARFMDGPVLAMADGLSTASPH
ncbi:MAG: hypothetical protein IT573_09495 [Deltaproteobacteria bacterium]|nr:hypothetical protein [Deltaproteobacteria bacterium]